MILLFATLLPLVLSSCRAASSTFPRPDDPGVERISNNVNNLIDKATALATAKHYLLNETNAEIRQLTPSLILEKPRRSEFVQTNDRHEREGPIKPPYYRFCFKFKGKGWNAYMNPADYFVAVDAYSAEVVRTGRDFHK
jgi:hypothetical protein